MMNAKSTLLALVAGCVAATLLLLSSCTSSVRMRGDYAPDEIRNLAEVTRSIDEASQFLAEWGTVTVSAPMVSTSADYFRFDPGVADKDLVAGRMPEGGAIRSAWKATFVNLALGPRLLDTADKLTAAASANPGETATQAKEAQERAEKQIDEMWDAFQKLDQNLQANLRRTYRGAASDKFELGLHRFLSDPAGSLPDSYRPVYVVFTVHCQPGWRTSDGKYIGRVDVQTSYEKPLADKNSTNEQPLVTAIYPANDMQDLMLVNSIADRSALRGGAVTPYGSVGVSADGGTDVAAATRTGLNVTTAFISGGGQFGYEFRPAYRATKDLNQLGSSPGLSLDPVAFPAVAIVGVRRGDWRFSTVGAALLDLAQRYTTKNLRAALSPELLAGPTWSEWKRRAEFGEGADPAPTIHETIKTTIGKWGVQKDNVTAALDAAAYSIRARIRDTSFSSGTDTTLFRNLAQEHAVIVVNAAMPDDTLRENVPRLLRARQMRTLTYDALCAARAAAAPPIDPDWALKQLANDPALIEARKKGAGESHEQASARKTKLISAVKQAARVDNATATTIADILFASSAQPDVALAASLRPPVSSPWQSDEVLWQEAWESCKSVRSLPRTPSFGDGNNDQSLLQISNQALEPYQFEHLDSASNDRFRAALIEIATANNSGFVVYMPHTAVVAAFAVEPKLTDEDYKKSNSGLATSVMGWAGDSNQVTSVIDSMMKSHAESITDLQFATAIAQTAGSRLDVDEAKLATALTNSSLKLSPSADVGQEVDKEFRDLDQSTRATIKRQIELAMGSRFLRFRANFDWRREGSPALGFRLFDPPDALPENQRTAILANLDHSLKLLNTMDDPNHAGQSASDDGMDRTIHRLRSDIERLRAQLEPAESEIQIPNMFDPYGQGVRIVQWQDPEWTSARELTMRLVLTNGGRMPLGTRARFEVVEGNMTTPPVVELRVGSDSVRENGCVVFLDRAGVDDEKYGKEIEKISDKTVRIVIYTQDGTLAESANFRLATLTVPPEDKK